MEQLFEYLKHQLNIDIIIVVLVILSGFFQDKYMGVFRWSKSDRYDASLKTLALSAAISLVYILLMYDFHKNASMKKGEPVDAIPWAKYLISYFAATSLYDLVINPFRKFITKKLGSDADDTNKPNT